MLSTLRKFLRPVGRLDGRAAAAPVPAPPAWSPERVYAIGDVHGRLDLLDALLTKIADDRSDHDGRPSLVFLGDLIDRGPASAGVVQRVIELTRDPAWDVTVLKGNHEEALLLFLDQPEFGPTWAEHGGGATLAAYGVRPPAGRTDAAAWTAARDAFAKALPADHLELYRGMELWTRRGDYLFVHAGVRPGVPLEAQDPKDLLWIRGEFISAPRAAEHVVVHGHTPVEQAQLTRWRIGVDTGAYATGLLTAVRLDGTDQRLIQARA
ncbi:serine/threonine protein phosphatase [Caulobacter sp. 17J80-11]|nr:metallophosphoesterase family protein [Caulobacter sp. 17J80-11]MBC6982490.1 serine/threonine protein phosphatase [Caulobacter sp. 17J80-11]